MPKKQTLVLQHAECERPGSIAQALEESGYEVKPVRAYSGDAVPRELGDHSGLVIMGGPMGVYEHDQYPFIRDELRLIEDALRRGKPILGVCLGSQLLASALGSTVRKGGQKEIGWHRVTFHEACAEDSLCQGLEPSLMAYHWHGDVFDLPCGSVHLASSQLTDCQAFRHGSKVYGFLFHMEITPAILDGMTTQFAEELKQAGLDRDEILRQASEYLQPLESAGREVFRRWTALLAE